MEPEIHTSSPSGVTSPPRPSSGEVLAHGLAVDEPPVPLSPAFVPAVTPSPGSHNGHANGTHVNGHANGSGHTNGNGHPVVVVANGHSWPTAVALATSPSIAVASPAEFTESTPGFYLRVGKRCLDVTGALFALIVTSPLMALVALLIKLESRGPILYRSTRIGRNGKPFTFLKLRSMVDGADRHRHHLHHLNECDGPVFKISNDPRVTRIGRLLRTTSIDEIPQFINVLRGEMSLVGPRPPIPDEVSRYEPWQMHRLDVRPGMTCLWQISGRSRIGFQEWMRLDLEYIRHQSLRLDLKILLRTVPAVLSREGAY
jgi:exopolysaccharide biosynthesis polyprenyl glycosylphosphotransferase